MKELENKSGLIKRIGVYTLVGLSFLGFTPECMKRHDNSYLRKRRFNLGISKIKKLIEYDGIKGTSPDEWNSICKELGICYGIEGPKNLTQKKVDIYLQKFGYEWDGREYVR